MRRRRAAMVLLLAGLLTVAPLPWPVTPVMGATFTVTSTADNLTNGDGQCTLREAIRAANNSASNDCGTASPASDVIVLQSGATYTLSLDPTAGNEDAALEDDLDILAAGTLTIQGNGATIERVGPCILNGTITAGEFRIFHVVASAANLTLQNVTVRNGCTDGSTNGGGVLNSGTLTVISSTIRNSRANVDGGGLFNTGTLTVIDSTISNNLVNDDGGGIYNGGVLTVTNSAISNNTAAVWGGGILNASVTMTVTSSTFSNNRADQMGGGIFNTAGSVATMTNSTVSGNSAGDDGGGIQNYGTLTMTNSTISGNRTDGGGGDDGGGIHNAGGTLNASFITVANNTANPSGQGGGIFQAGGTVNIKNSIVGDNTAATGANCQGTVVTSGTNYATDASCTGFTQVPSTGAGGLNLGPLQVNPPGTTATHALQVGSAAINAVTDCTDLSNNPVTADQRGVSRPQPSGGQCDAGAYEAPPIFSLTVDGAGTGSGTVTASGISCNISSGSASGDCTEDYAQGTTVTLSASAGANSVFAGWSGDPDCTDGQVTMNANKTCTATFNVVQRTLTIGGAGTGSGTVTASGISCSISSGSASGDCTEPYADGTIVNLTAMANPGSTFAGWTGDPDCFDGQLTMNANKACVATFNLQQGTIIITKATIGGDGTFNFTGSGSIGSFAITTSGGSGTQSFTLAPGTYTVTEATPPTGWSFTNLACTDPTSNTTVNLNNRQAQINLAANETVTCTFTNTRQGVSLFVLQQGNNCLALDLLNRQYTLRTASGTFSGAIEFTRTSTTIRFRSARGVSPTIVGTIDLRRRTGNVIAAFSLSQRLTIVDSNIDDNGPCP
ncbi:MAG: choice-of-anchor Q domain-containing protein [Acidobacteriota bacterium]|nr:choice-of-anchor Q domain-containing protein [Acidobacteriota bacterium]